MEFFGSVILENKNNPQKIYLLMNKPQGYVCSYVSDSHKTVYDLLPPELQSLMKEVRGKRLHTVGRLDCNTSGLLLLTNDGYYSNFLTRAENHVEKVYKAELENPVNESLQKEYIKKFKEGLILPPEKKAPEEKASPSKIEFLSTNECLVTVNEGKFHQVRRMFLAVENQVIKLQRLKIGSIFLPEDLAEGKFIYFSPTLENF